MRLMKHHLMKPEDDVLPQAVREKIFAGWPGWPLHDVYFLGFAGQCQRRKTIAAAANRIIEKQSVQGLIWIKTSA